MSEPSVPFIWICARNLVSIGATPSVLRSNVIKTWYESWYASLEN